MTLLCILWLWAGPVSADSRFNAAALDPAERAAGWADAATHARSPEDAVAYSGAMYDGTPALTASPSYDGTADRGGLEKPTPGAAGQRRTAPPPPKQEPKGPPSALVYGGAAVLGGVQGWIAGGLVGAAVGIGLGLGAAALWQNGQHGAAFGMSLGSIVGTFLGGPIGAVIGGLLGALIGWGAQKLLSKS